MPFDKVKLCDRDTCTGCEACQSVCPQECIRMVDDDEGFLYPAIDEDKCIRCHRCRDVCPILTAMPASFQRKEIPKTYACWINEDSIRLRSSSGGLFSALAMDVLKDGGVVFGAAFDEHMHLHHIAAEKVDDLDLLRRSKYIQSEIGDAYRQVKDCLDRGRRVFFVGAPCQIGGLNAYLGKDADGLLTADFICHGVPSPGVFAEYVKYLEDIYGRHIKDINFRDKRKGWPNSQFAIAGFHVGKEVVLSGRMNGFRYGFCKDYFLRKSCYDCAFKTMPRCADFTFADFSGIEEKYPNESHKGISCLLINSSKGEQYPELLKARISFFEESFAEARGGNRNLYRSATIPPARKAFFEDFGKKPFTFLMKKYLTPSLTTRIRAFSKCHLSLRAVLFIQKAKRLNSSRQG